QSGKEKRGSVSHERLTKVLGVVLQREGDPVLILGQFCQRGPQDIEKDSKRGERHFSCLSIAAWHCLDDLESRSFGDVEAFHQESSFANARGPSETQVGTPPGTGARDAFTYFRKRSLSPDQDRTVQVVCLDAVLLSLTVGDGGVPMSHRRRQKSVANLTGVAWAILRRLGEQAVNHLTQTTRNLGVETVKKRRTRTQLRKDRGVHITAGERTFSAQCLVEQASQSIVVRPDIEGPGHEAFRRHVRSCSNCSWCRGEIIATVVKMDRYPKVDE